MLKNLNPKECSKVLITSHLIKQNSTTKPVPDKKPDKHIIQKYKKDINIMSFYVSKSILDTLF